MSKPHWTRTFAQTDLVTIGCIRTRANEDTISAGGRIATTVLAGLVFVLYSTAEETTPTKIAFAITFSLIAASLSLFLYCNSSTVGQGITPEPVENAESDGVGVRWLWELRGFEITLVIINVIVLAVSETGLNAITAVVFFEMKALLMPVSCRLKRRRGERKRISFITRHRHST